MCRLVVRRLDPSRWCFGCWVDWARDKRRVTQRALDTYDDFSLIEETRLRLVLLVFFFSFQKWLSSSTNMYWTFYSFSSCIWVKVSNENEICSTHNWSLKFTLKIFKANIFQFETHQLSQTVHLSGTPETCMLLQTERQFYIACGQHISANHIKRISIQKHVSTRQVASNVRQMVMSRNSMVNRTIPRKTCRRARLA